MKSILSVLLIMFVLFVSGCSKSNETEEQKKLTFKTERQKESYSVGFRAGIRLYGMVKNNDIDLDVALQGVKDAVNERPQLPKKELQEIYSRFTDKLMKRQTEREQARALQNKIQGETFLKENAAREGVIVTGSGLQYKVLKEGTGPIPKETDIAVVHYRGTLLNGTEVFNTYKRGEPIKLPVQRSLPAWKEALQLMKVGTRFVLFIPPNLAYKNHGKPPLIGANMVLIYEVELLGIE
ncbi:MAG: FKBP-type peptidyl-prolyl cis-trans isomerase [Candidatus Aminicenantes bacterium]|jgi:FKBP-type peptidyl-prolyl cis-trans isomerase